MLFICTDCHEIRLPRRLDHGDTIRCCTSEQGESEDGSWVVGTFHIVNGGFWLSPPILVAQLDHCCLPAARDSDRIGVVLQCSLCPATHAGPPSSWPATVDCGVVVWPDQIWYSDPRMNATRTWSMVERKPFDRWALESLALLSQEHTATHLIQHVRGNNKSLDFECAYFEVVAQLCFFQFWRKFSLPSLTIVK